MAEKEPYQMGKLFFAGPLDEQTILIGSDGVEDLIEAINKGLIEEYRDLQEFIRDEKNFSDPIHIPKFLKKYSRNGILRDDCTLIILKK